MVCILVHMKDGLLEAYGWQAWERTYIIRIHSQSAQNRSAFARARNLGSPRWGKI